MHQFVPDTPITGKFGAYYHPLFKRDNKELCQQMTCLGSKMAQNLEPLNPVALGLATPKMIEHGLLSGMAPKRGSHSAASKKKAANPSQQQRSIAPPSSTSSGTPSSSSLYFQSQLLADPRSHPRNSCSNMSTKYWIWMLSSLAPCGNIDYSFR